MPPNGILQFDRIANFRDVGLYTSSISKTQCMNPHLLYRSARPDLASPFDIHTLQSLPINTILDLRTGTERRVFTTPDSPSQHRLPVLAVSLTGTRFRIRLLSHLPWLPWLWCVLLLLFRQIPAAVRILAKPMGERGLTGMATDTLEGSWAEFRTIFERLSSREAWPVLVHCTQGKDRTGLVVLLLCLLAGVEQKACEMDYMLTQSELADGREERVKETKRYGLPETFVDCEEGWVDNVVGYIDGRWGGVEEYLDWCGIPRDQVQAVKDILTTSEQ